VLTGKNLVSLLKLNEKIDFTKKIFEILYAISQNVIKLLGAERSTIYIYDEEKNELYSYVASQLEIDEIRLKVGEGIAGKVAESRIPIIVDNVENNTDFNAYYDSQTNYKTRNLITVPLLNREDKLIGVVQVLNKKNSKFNKNEDLEKLNCFAPVAAIAIEQAKIADEKSMIKEKNSLLIENFNAGILIIDNQYVVQDFNKKYLEIFKLDYDIEKKNIREIHKAIFDRIENLSLQGTDLKIRQNYYHIDISDLTDINEKKVGWVILATDVTEKVIFNQKKALEERMSILGKMSSQIFHDIKNPLFIIKGYLQLIDDCDKKGENEQYFEIIRSEIERILSIIQEILHFSKGEVEVFPEKFTFQDFESYLLQFLEKINNTFNAEIGLQIYPEVVKIKHLNIDVKKIERALSNIVFNSIEAVETDNLNGQVQIQIDFKDKMLHLYIKDKGKGIPEDIKEHIFEPFFTQNKAKGTGLGLPIAKAIIEKHQGSIELKNKENDWNTIFLIQLPVEI